MASFGKAKTLRPTSASGNSRVIISRMSSALLARAASRSSSSCLRLPAIDSGFGKAPTPQETRPSNRAHAGLLAATPAGSQCSHEFAPDGGACSAGSRRGCTPRIGALHPSPAPCRAPPGWLARSEANHLASRPRGPYPGAHIRGPAIGKILPAAGGELTSISSIEL